MLQLKLLAVIAALALLLAACTPPETPAAAEIVTLYVAVETAECVGTGPQTCLLVREDPGQDWEFFYSSIEGFTYEPGYEYVLIVEKQPVEAPPADGSSIRWVLVEMVAATPVESGATPTPEIMQPPPASPTPATFEGGAAGEFPPFLEPALVRDLTVDLGGFGAYPLTGGTFADTEQMIDVHMGELMAFGDLNSDQADDAALIVSIATGGSGSFVHLIPMLNTPEGLRQAGLILLGDRVRPRSLAIIQGQITLGLRTHGSGDPLCCPSAFETWTYALQDGLLVETATEEGDTAPFGITIEMPEDGAQITANTPFEIGGTGRGLFEGGLVVELRDSSGQVLFAQPLTLQGIDVGAGQPGTWSLTVTPDVQPGAVLFIVAYATSPRDGSINVIDSIAVFVQEG